MEQQIPPTQPPVQPEIPPTPRHTPLLAFVVVAFFMLVFGLAGGYFLANKVSIRKASTNGQFATTITPTSTITSTAIPTSATNDWQTYTNQQYGISFEYPSDWKTENPYGTPSSLDFVGLIPKGKQKGVSVTPIMVEHRDNPQNLSLSAFEDMMDAKQAMPLNLYSSTAQTTSVAGFPAYLTEKAGCDPLLCERVVIMAKNSIFVFYNVQIDQYYSSAELASNKVIFDQILQTVKFIN